MRREASPDNCYAVNVSPLQPAIQRLTGDSAGPASGLDPVIPQG